MSDMVFPLPDVGEGLTEAELVTWHVTTGDTVALNQVICEIETAKSIVELPSPFAGTVTELLAKEGDTVPVGEPIMRVSAEGIAESDAAPQLPSAVGEVGDDAAAEAQAAEQDRVASTDSEPPARPSASDDAEAGGAVLVGYGTGGAVRSRRRSGGEPLLKPAPIREAAAGPGGSPVALAKPPIRKLAKDLQVDLAEVIGSGVAGEILREDVVNQATQASVFRNLETPSDPPPAREERIPLKGVRKHIAKAMAASSNEAPHVSVFVDVDATRTMEFVQRLKKSTDFVGVKVSPLLIMAKAIIWAIRRNPQVNSSFTEKEIIQRYYVNLGIAAATPRGLLVPNIKDAQDLSLLELAKAIEQLTITAREGRTQPAEMQDGTITITNIGVFGMDFGTPILNPGEAAIVAMGTIKQKPWVVDGEVRPRFVTTVGGSFDHRIIDGDVVSRFVADIASVLEEPALLLD